MPCFFLSFFDAISTDIKSCSSSENRKQDMLAMEQKPRLCSLKTLDHCAINEQQELNKQLHPHVPSRTMESPNMACI